MRTPTVLCLALATGLVAMSASTRADSLLEKIATVILADKFGIDTREVVDFRQQTQLSPYELAPVYQGAYYFKQKPSTVWQLRKQGLGWGQIAQRLGMHPGTFNKLRNQGAFDQDRFWKNSYQDRFGVSTQRVDVMRKQGGTLENVLGAIIVGKLTKTDPRRIYDQYQTQQSWTTITNNNNVRFDQWQRVSVPVRTVYVMPTSTKGIKVKSKSDKRWDGKGKSHGKMDKAKGHEKHKLSGNSVGKGDKSKVKHGNGAGKGSGKGKGKGKGG